MRITKLTLENFRSFKEKQSIEFAPVTLLFGPNSVGKSTVLMALFYIRHILVNGDCNPLRLEELGNKYVGGFEGLVHGRDLKKTIRIGVEYSKGNSIGSSYTEIRDLLNENENEDIDWLFSLPDASGTVENVAIEFIIAWSAQHKNAFVSECLISLDKEEFATLKSTSDGLQPFIESINYLHPLLVGDDHDEWVEFCFDSQIPMHPKIAHRAFTLKGMRISGDIPEFTDADIDYEKLIEDPVVETDEAFVSRYHEALNNETIPETKRDNPIYKSIAAETMFLHSRLPFRNTVGAVPILGKGLDTKLDFENRKEGALIIEILSDAILPAFDNLSTLLEDSICIGPLRVIPDPTYKPNPNPQVKDWYNGLTAWDCLDKMSNTLLAETDYWMGYKLSLGYGVAIQHVETSSEYKHITFKPIEYYEKYPETLDKGGIVCTIPPNGEMKVLSSQNILMNNKETINKVSIWDSINNIPVSPADIGVGVSQVLPLVIASLVRERGLIAVEQPELHVHPRVQTGLGDLLTQASKGASLLVETHSEHLILRLLKRIRQTTDKELPNGIGPVTQDDVSIVYLENSDDGVRAKRIHIDEDGEFQQHWPDGFFSERREELM